MEKRIWVMVTFLAILGCKKQRYPSSWTVNKEPFSTDQVNYGFSFGGSGLSTVSQENGFSIFLAGGQSMRYGTHPINNLSGGRSYRFYYYGKSYIPSWNQNSNMQASTHDDKAVLTIPPTWFIKSEFDSAGNIVSNGDSVLIAGVLHEP